MENNGFTIRIPPKKRMPIDILPDIKIKTVKIYPLKFIDRQIINKTFVNLHAQKRMEFITQPIFTGIRYSLFGARYEKNEKKV